MQMSDITSHGSELCKEEAFRIPVPKVTNLTLLQTNHILKKDGWFHLVYKKRKRIWITKDSSSVIISEHQLNVNIFSIYVRYDNKLKIIIATVPSVLLNSVLRWKNNEHNPECLLCLLVVTALHSVTSILFHYFPIWGLRLNSTDYTLFLNDHSWGLQMQKPFNWLGPLGLPYITNHFHQLRPINMQGIHLTWWT